MLFTSIFLKKHIKICDISFKKLYNITYKLKRVTHFHGGSDKYRFLRETKKDY